MLRGEHVALRPVRRDELPVLYGWDQDADLVAMTDADPYRPDTYEDWVKRWDEPPPGKVAFFGIQEGVADDGRLIGRCHLWRIDECNRNAHIGITLGAGTDRGKGLGREALSLLVDYGFRLRGLHRLQLETFAHNPAMRRCAEAVGFTEEGRLRESGWAAGRFGDDVIHGLLAREWRTRPGADRSGAAE